MCEKEPGTRHHRHPTHYPGRGFIETLILWIVHKQPLHGYGVKKEIEHLPISYQPKPGAIYTILRRMDRKGLLTSAWEKRAEKKDRRIYKVTEEGEHLLTSRLEIMQQRVILLKQMLNYYDENLASEKTEEQ